MKPTAYFELAEKYKRLQEVNKDLLKACKVAADYIDWAIGVFNPLTTFDVTGLRKLIEKIEGRESE